MICAIGDIHGEYDKLLSLLEKLGDLSQYSNIVFLGDYIDRGNNSKAVIKKLKELKEKYNIVIIKGNHEDMMIHAIGGNSDMYDCWLANGGVECIKSYKKDWHELEHIPNNLIEDAIWLNENSVLYFVTEYYNTKLFFSHTGVSANFIKTYNTNKEELEKAVKQYEFYFLWNSSNDSIDIPDNCIVIHGHEITNKPWLRMYKNNRGKIGIDTGSFRKKDCKLTSIVLSFKNKIKYKFITN